jgi:hypothetical protein
MSCEDIDGCGSTRPSPFRAIIYDEDNRNVLYGNDRPDTVFFYTVKDGVRYSEKYYQITNIGDSSQLGLYSDFLSESDIPSSNTYYLEIEGDVDTLQVEIIEEIDEKGCTYLTYGTVEFNEQTADHYPWKRGGGYVLKK